jgi:predicted nucleic acid-binding protein
MGQGYGGARSADERTQVIAFLDTSVVVRYLVGDQPQQAEQAAAIIDSDEPLHVTDVVLLETAYVLTSVYQVPRQVVVDQLIVFLQRANILPAVLRKELVLQALLLCRLSGRVSFADALIWSAARSTAQPVVYSFDRRFPVEGIEVRSHGL